MLISTARIERYYDRLSDAASRRRVVSEEFRLAKRDLDIARERLERARKVSHVAMATKSQRDADRFANEFEEAEAAVPEAQARYEKARDRFRDLDRGSSLATQQWSGIVAAIGALPRDARQAIANELRHEIRESL